MAAGRVRVSPGDGSPGYSPLGIAGLPVSWINWDGVGGNRAGCPWGWSVPGENLPSSGITGGRRHFAALCPVLLGASHSGDAQSSGLFVGSKLVPCSKVALSGCVSLNQNMACFERDPEV